MLLLGLILIALGGLAIVAAVFTAELNDGKIEYLGTDLSALAIFLVGLGAGAAILLGLSLFKWGTKRGLARRREQKKMDELSEKLGQADARRTEDLDRSDEDRPSI